MKITKGDFFIIQRNTDNKRETHKVLEIRKIVDDDYVVYRENDSIFNLQEIFRPLKWNKEIGIANWYRYNWEYKITRLQFLRNSKYYIPITKKDIKKIIERGSYV